VASEGVTGGGAASGGVTGEPVLNSRRGPEHHTTATSCEAVVQPGSESRNRRGEMESDAKHARARLRVLYLTALGLCGMMIVWIAFLPGSCTTSQLAPQVGGLTLVHCSAQPKTILVTEATASVHFSAQPETFLPMRPLNTANKKCSRQAEKWMSIVHKCCLP